MSKHAESLNNFPELLSISERWEQSITGKKYSEMRHGMELSGNPGIKSTVIPSSAKPEGCKTQSESSTIHPKELNGDLVLSMPDSTIQALRKCLKENSSAWIVCSPDGSDLSLQSGLNK